MTEHVHFAIIRRALDEGGPAGFAVIGKRTGKVYGTFPDEAEADAEAARLERKLELRGAIRRTVLQAIEDGETEDRGICFACGADAYGVEPDARGYRCDACGMPEVYGLEEAVLML